MLIMTGQGFLDFTPSSTVLMILLLLPTPITATIRTPLAKHAARGCPSYTRNPSITITYAPCATKLLLDRPACKLPTCICLPCHSPSYLDESSLALSWVCDCEKASFVIVAVSSMEVCVYKGRETPSVPSFSLLHAFDAVLLLRRRRQDLPGRDHLSPAYQRGRLLGLPTLDPTDLLFRL